MPTSSSKRIPVAPYRVRIWGRARFSPHIRPPLALLCCVFAPAAPLAAKERESYAPTLAQPTPPAPPDGAIYRRESYIPLTSGARATRVGDILTIVLAERTSASKANSGSTDRGGSIGLTPPTTGPLSVIRPSDVGASGTQTFKGKGEAELSNALSGEISVTVMAVNGNGTLLVRGEKLLTLGRGDERIQLSGLVRDADIGPDNRVPSTRIADARIRYFGKGYTAKASRPGWLQRLFSSVSPF